MRFDDSGGCLDPALFAPSGAPSCLLLFERLHRYYYYYYEVSCTLSTGQQEEAMTNSPATGNHPAVAVVARCPGVFRGRDAASRTEREKRGGHLGGDKFTH